MSINAKQVWNSARAAVAFYAESSPEF